MTDSFWTSKAELKWRVSLRFVVVRIVGVSSHLLTECSIRVTDCFIRVYRSYKMMPIEFLLAMRAYRDTVNLFRVHLMAICKESQLKTLVSVNRCKRKPPYDTLFWVTRRPGEFGGICWKFVGGVCIWSSVGPHRAGSYQTSTKAGTIVRASSKFYGHWWLQFSVWKGTTANPYKKIRLLTLVTGVPLQGEYDQIRGTYSQKKLCGRNWINI